MTFRTWTNAVVHRIFAEHPIGGARAVDQRLFQPFHSTARALLLARASAVVTRHRHCCCCCCISSRHRTRWSLSQSVAVTWTRCQHQSIMIVAFSQLYGRHCTRPSQTGCGNMTIIGNQWPELFNSRERHRFSF